MEAELRWLVPKHASLKYLTFDQEGRVTSAHNSNPSSIVYNWPLLMPRYKYVGSITQQHQDFGYFGGMNTTFRESEKGTHRHYKLVPPHLRQKKKLRAHNE